MNTDGLILDIDGTIWNTTPIVAEAWNKAIDELFPNVPHVTAEILQQQFGKTMSVIADNLFVGLNDEEKKTLIDQCCVKEHIAIEENTSCITYEGVVETIKNLSQKVKIYIVSNCQDGYIPLVIKKNGLENYISDFECYGRTGKDKADNISLIVKRNNISKPVYVGDTLGDASSCKLCGVPFIWASYGFGKVSEYDGIINKFSDLNTLLTF